MKYKINGYKPESVFHFFEEISAIPRSSLNEKAISEYLVNFAKERGLESYTDDIHNVVIKKPGSVGNESKPAVAMQGHSDMVCEKNTNVEHDFDTQGIELIVDNEKNTVSANGTTLGADNGIAIALMLAILDDKTLVHPPLECVITTQEEIGLNGAEALDGSVLDARMMINLDAEEEGIATVSCAGGTTYEWKKTIKWETISDAKLLRLSITGLLGGHSGMEIQMERGNANKLMARVLHYVWKAADGRIATLSGGNKDNAIPREAFCTLVFETKEQRAAAEKAAQDIKAVLLDELLADEPGFKMEIVCENDDTMKCFSQEDTRNVSQSLYLALDGAQKRNVSNGGFIVTSLNLGVVTTGTEEFTVVFAPRSSVASMMDDVVERLELIGSLFAYTSSQSGTYPGWKYAEVSRLRDVFCESYQELFQSELKIEAIHAGLECGLFSDKLPGLDAIAVGPAMWSVHTPDETLDLKSVERTWILLTDVLCRLSK